MLPFCSTWNRAFSLVLSLGFAALLMVPVAGAQSATSRPASGERATDEQVGYLLADKVFAEPSAASDEVTSVTRNDRVRVTTVAGKDGWYEVYRVGESEPLGYAFRPYVSRFGPQGIASYTSKAASDQPLFEVAFSPVPDDAGATYTVHTWANVRIGPGIEHPAFGVIRPAVPFQVLDVEQGWGEVRLQGERGVGYVSASLLHRPPGPEPVAAEPAGPDEPIRGAVVDGAAGGGVSDAAEAPEVSQEEALREALLESGVNTEATVYVTRTGRKFHREGCRHLRARTFAIPLAEAMMDFSPCRTCKPLQPADEPED